MKTFASTGIVKYVSQVVRALQHALDLNLLNRGSFMKKFTSYLLISLILASCTATEVVDKTKAPMVKPAKIALVLVLELLKVLPT